MVIRNRVGSWNELVLVLNGHVAESREIIPSEVVTVIHLGINDVAHVFDQIAALDNYERPKYRFEICGEQYVFNLEMATELLAVVQQACYDYEYG